MIKLGDMVYGVFVIVLLRSGMTLPEIKQLIEEECGDMSERARRDWQKFWADFDAYRARIRLNKGGSACR